VRFPRKLSEVTPAQAAGAVAAAVVVGLVLRKMNEPPGLAPSLAIIDELDGSIQPLAKRLLKRAHSAGIELVVASGLRSNAEQAALYAQGRTEPGPVVTHAPPGTSWHNYGLAFDVAVLSGGEETYPRDPDLWQAIGDLGRSVGLGWGGDYPSGQTDLPHFEYHPGLTIADAMTGMRPA